MLLSSVGFSINTELTVVVLGDRCEFDVGSKLQWALKVARHKGVVDSENGISMALHNGSNSFDVAHLKERVGWGLNPHKLERKCKLIKKDQIQTLVF